MTLKRKPRPKMGTRAPQHLRSPAHLQWIRGTLACLAASVDGDRCEGKNHAHHVRLGAGAGIGQKPGDDRAIPLCAFHHGELHTIGQRTFAERYRVDFEKAISEARVASPHLRKIAMEDRNARRNHSKN